MAQSSTIFFYLLHIDLCSLWALDVTSVSVKLFWSAAFFIDVMTMVVSPVSARCGKYQTLIRVAVVKRGIFRE